MDSDEREIVSGLPRKKEPAQPLRSTPLRVAASLYRICFECGCVYDRVFKGQFAGAGFQVTPCYAHSLNLTPVIAAGEAAIKKAQVQT